MAGSVLFSEVSSFQRLKRMQEWYSWQESVLFREMSSVQGGPYSYTETVALGSKCRTVGPLQLLRDLDYTDTVTVHVVQNGQEMPTFKKWTAHNFLC